MLKKRTARDLIAWRSTGKKKSESLSPPAAFPRASSFFCFFGTYYIYIYITRAGSFLGLVFRMATISRPRENPKPPDPLSLVGVGSGEQKIREMLADEADQGAS